MKIVMTLLVRDASGLLRENIEHHLAQGVDYFIVTDNRSTDSTAEIIQHYVDAGLADGIFEPEDTYSQWRWVTRMARRAAAEHGATWVINSDDDEFWSAEHGTLASVLAEVPSSCMALQVERRNHPPIAGPQKSHFLAYMVFKESRSYNAFGDPLPPKVIHRAFADVDVSQGNHAASRAGTVLASIPTGAIGISHFPVRDFASFERKIVQGGAAYARNPELPSSAGATWRFLYDVWKQGNLRDWYENQLLTSGAIALALGNGSLTRDDSIFQRLRDGVACPSMVS